MKPVPGVLGWRSVERCPSRATAKGPISCLLFLIGTFYVSSTSGAELIVLASPPDDDTYYSEVSDDIFDFHIAYAKQLIANGDRVLILASRSAYTDYVAELGEDKVLEMPMFDIWMRDYFLSNATHPVMFRYTAAGQGGDQVAADEVQETLAVFLEDAGLRMDGATLLNDGGNFVDDYAGNVVVSKKFLRDNNLSEDAARQVLRSFDGIEQIAFIEADEQGGLEHADGVVSFVDINTLIINAYPSDPAYARQLVRDIRRGLPNVRIHEIVTPYDDSSIYDARFGSACGLYTNALVTPERIYLPQFGVPEDEIALAQVRAVTTRQVIPVDSRNVCTMGGGVRCMSGQLRGTHAEHVLDYLTRRVEPE